MKTTTKKVIAFSQIPTKFEIYIEELRMCKLEEGERLVIWRRTLGLEKQEINIGLHVTKEEFVF